MRVKILGILLLACLSVLTELKVHAQVTVEVKMDTNMLLIGDQTNFRIKANYPDTYSVNFPVFADTIVKGLEVLNISDIDTNIVDGNIELWQELLVTSFDSGWYEVPPLDFVIGIAGNDRTDTLQSNPVYFGVITMPIDTTQANAITDIKKPLDAPLTLREVLPIVGITFGALVIILAIVLLVMRLTRKEPIFVKKEKPKEPAHVIAYRELEQLKDQKLWQQGKVKEYYSELTEIIRRYIENRYAIQALEMTTDEIIDAFRISGDLDKELKNGLFDLLVQADFVKFAKASTLADENENNFKFVYHFVNETKPVVALRDEDGEEESEEKESLVQSNSEPEEK